jgi:hypothetical protein
MFKSVVLGSKWRCLGWRNGEEVEMEKCQGDERRESPCNQLFCEESGALAMVLIVLVVGSHGILWVS